MQYCNKYEAPITAGKQFQLVEWSDQVRPVTSIRQGAVRRRFFFQIRLLTEQRAQEKLVRNVAIHSLNGWPFNIIPKNMYLFSPLHFHNSREARNFRR